MRHPSPFSNKTTPQDLDTVFRQVRFTYLAFLASTLIYGLVGVLLKQFIMGAEPGFVGLDPSTYSLILILFVIIGVLLLLIFPRKAEWAEAQTLIETR